MEDPTFRPETWVSRSQPKRSWVRVSAVYDSREDTEKHIAQVRGLLLGAASDLAARSEVHDASKLVEPEKGTFDRVTPQLRALTYGSPDYKAALESMGPALAHHYEVNDHHPEHFPPGPVHETDVEVEAAFHPSGDEYTFAIATCGECDWTQRGDEGDVRDAAAMHEEEHFKPGGINEMNLLQLLEMVCDWVAATRRHDDGDIHRSIDLNAERFGYGEPITSMLHATADELLRLEVNH